MATYTRHKRKVQTMLTIDNKTTLDMVRNDFINSYYNLRSPEKKKAAKDNYLIASGIVGRKYKKADGSIYEKKKTIIDDNEFLSIVDFVKSLGGCKLYCEGSWIWITGNTFKHREELKECGFKWSGSRKAWYIADKKPRKAATKKSAKNDFNLDDQEDLPFI